jgi:hypothetical protein
MAEPNETDVLHLVAEVRRLRSTVDILWSTMNRDIKALADDALEAAGLPSVEGGYRATEQEDA